MLPIHWGAFQLANHPWDDPAVRFLKAFKKNNIEVVTPKIGETMDNKNYTDFMDHWWERIE